MGTGNYSLIKTVSTGETITAADRNAEHQNHINNMNFPGLDDYSTNASQMQSTADPYPSSVESLATTGAGELERLRYVLKQITGEAQWYIDPDVSLATIFSTYTTLANIQANAMDYAVDSGSADALAVAFTPTITALTPGMILVVKTAAANATTTPTLDVDGLGAVTITRNSGALLAGDIKANGYSVFQYYTTGWNLLNPILTGTSDINDGAVTTAKLAADAVTSAKVADGAVVQVVTYQRGDLVTGATVMPYDDTIPQNTEGNELLTLAITPKSTTNKLIIDVNATIGSPANQYCSGAIFQDSTAGALAASVVYPDDTATVPNPFVLRHTMTAGTVSETTFKFRAGSDSGSIYLNGNSAARIFGGVAASSITITEVKAS